MKTTWFKVKIRAPGSTERPQSVRIPKPKSVSKLLDQGFVVSKVVETKEGHGGINHIAVKTWSPRTREQYYKAGGTD